ncbi:MAG: tRNA 2-selenouridine synthase, partial [Candidatus Melainabacteria bacterium]|nr:tRNA 2-selenouridine synthase [Candidatus Melainabacteria bacterium]
MEWRELAVEDLDGLKSPLIIDVRSPSEFAVERIPEAINIPLLSDAERV